MIVTITRHYIYGTSGTELPPPCVKVITKAILQLETETEADFRRRITDYCINRRLELLSEPAKAYSCHDGFDWEFVEVGELE